MDSAALSALSPVDGRYRKSADGLRAVLSESGLIRERIRIEAVRLEAAKRSQDETMAEIGEHPKQSAVWRALQLDRMMRSKGLLSPYVVVQQPVPLRAGRGLLAAADRWLGTDGVQARRLARLTAVYTPSAARP